MEALKQYCLSICCIDDIDTYIISPKHYASLMADQELLEKLCSSYAKNSSWAMKLLLYFMQVSKAMYVDKLYPAFGHHKDRAGRSLEWQPVLCYQKEHLFFHVKYHDSWMCRSCGYVFCAPIIMPMCEAEPDFYDGTKNRFPAISPLFQKLPCPKCSSLLQNHWIMLR